MKKFVNYLFYFIIVVLLSTDIYLQVTKPQMEQPVDKPNVDVEERVKALEEKCNGLQLEMEDVKNVQGYIVWERDWRNKERTR